MTPWKRIHRARTWDSSFSSLKYSTMKRFKGPEILMKVWELFRTRKAFPHLWFFKRFFLSHPLYRTGGVYWETPPCPALHLFSLKSIQFPWVWRGKGSSLSSDYKVSACCCSSKLSRVSLLHCRSFSLVIHVCRRNDNVLLCRFPLMDSVVVMTVNKAPFPHSQLAIHILQHKTAKEIHVSCLTPKCNNTMPMKISCTVKFNFQDYGVILGQKFNHIWKKYWNCITE